MGEVGEGEGEEEEEEEEGVKREVGREVVSKTGSEVEMGRMEGVEVDKERLDMASL